MIGEIFKYVNKLNLESFNNQKIHFSNCVELSSLMGDYMEIVIKDLLEFDKGLSLRNNDEIIRSRVFSEIEGTLNIEDVPTTRKLVSELSNKKRKPQNRNETIIVNMINAIEFVNSCPDFNKENLYKNCYYLDKAFSEKKVTVTEYTGRINILVASFVGLIVPYLE